MENGTILPVRVRERERKCVCGRERAILLRAATEQALAKVYVVHICLRVCHIYRTYREVVYLWFAEQTSHRERNISAVYQSGLQTGLKFPCKRGYREGEIHTHNSKLTALLRVVVCVVLVV